MIFVVALLFISSLANSGNACSFHLDIFEEKVYNCQAYRVAHLQKQVNSILDQYYRSAENNPEAETEEEVKTLIAENEKLLKELSETWNSVKNRQETLLNDLAPVTKQAKQMKVEVDSLNDQALKMEETVSIQKQKAGKYFEETETKLQSNFNQTAQNLANYLQLYNTIPTEFSTNIDEFALKANDVVNSLNEKFIQVDLSAIINAVNALNNHDKVDFSDLKEKVEEFNETLVQEMADIFNNTLYKELFEVFFQVFGTIEKSGKYMPDKNAVKSIEIAEQLIEKVRNYKKPEVDETLIKHALALQKKLEDIPFINATNVELAANKAIEKAEEMTEKVVKIDEMAKENTIALNKMVEILSV